MREIRRHWRKYPTVMLIIIAAGHWIVRIAKISAAIGRPVLACVAFSMLPQPSLSLSQSMYPAARQSQMAKKCACNGHFVFQLFFQGGARNEQQMEIRTMSSTDKIIRLKTVLARTGLSRSTMYRKIADGTFPSQVKISIHGAGWRESAVNRWIDDPVSYRNEGAAQ